MTGPLVDHRLLWVGSGSSIHALERPLPRIKLTFTWQGSLVPQQRMSVTIPQRAILVVDFGRNRWRYRIGNGGGFESETLALLIRNTHRYVSGRKHGASQSLWFARPSAGRYLASG
jgi:hypothetical protein